MKKQIGDRMIERLTQFCDELLAGKPLQVTEVVANKEAISVRRKTLKRKQKT